MTALTAEQELDIFARLAAPFHENDVCQGGKGGQTFAYVRAYALMNRLDDVIGTGRWWDDYLPGKASILCRLTIELPDGRHITKCGAGGAANMQDAGDNEKSAYTDAFKNACAKFGIARYLRGDGSPLTIRDRVEELGLRPCPEPFRKGGARTGFAGGGAGGGASQRSQERPASSGGRSDRTAPADTSGERQGRQDGKSYGPPRTGRQLFAWIQDQRVEGLLKAINAWAKERDLPYRMVDWQDENAVQAAHAYARTFIVGDAGTDDGDDPDRGAADEAFDEFDSAR